MPPNTIPPTASSLVRFLEPFNTLLRRSESRAALQAYVTGLASPAESKTATEIARVVPGTSSQRLQEFLTRTSWDEQEMNRRRLEQLAAYAVAPGGVQVLDEVVIPKAGLHSVGASRQCRGPRGGARNCQRVVTSHYTDDVFDWPVGARLYLPREWSDDGERRTAARIPEEVEYLSREQIAAQLLEEAREAGLPGKPVVVGTGLSDLTSVLDDLDRDGRAYVAAIEGVNAVDLGERAPMARNGRGPTSAEVAASIPRNEWRRLAWREANGISRVRDFASVPARRHSPSGAVEGVLLLQRTLLGDRPPALFFGARLDDGGVEAVARLARFCGAANAYYEGEARRLGFEDYEGRLWVGFNRHVALVHLATSYRVLHDAYT